ncbi:TapB family protein [Siphonobacter aquaeclarae]|uniref:DUF3108 domain-containing protein n=1 Tax=Siphonobacter aquaeclarae TaxID=563176 RepID=A0A1G9K4Z6_9BACT|nr:hypothetical protein [Siphonobacter aquaeclarae]SDL44841.1 hypothetical protein SAMN04488090_0883 [Siphonobacter aquaeclarae]
MKTYLIALLISWLVRQTPDGFYYLREGKQIEMTTFDSAGKRISVSRSFISGVRQEGAATLADMRTEKRDAAGKLLEETVSSSRLENGDLRLAFPVPGRTDTPAFLAYPSELRAGQTLPSDVDFSFESTVKGKRTRVHFAISERRVTGRETVQALAQAWNCFKISYLLKVQFKVLGIGIPMNYQITEWFAPGFGVVKTEAWNGSKLENRSLLTSIQP